MTANTTPATLTANDPAGLTGTTPTAPATVEEIAANAAAAAVPAAPAPAPVAAAPAPAPVPAAPAPAPAPAAPVPNVTGAGLPGRSRTGGNRPDTLHAAATMVAAANRGEITPDALRAALADIVPGGPTASPSGVTNDGGWIGHLWSGVQYQRRMVGALSAGRAVNALKVRGYRWNPAPEVDTYAGNKGEVPSNDARTELVEVPVTRLAGAHDIDRAYWDLGDADFIAAYWEAMREDYAAKSDALATAAVLTATGAGSAGAATGMGTIVAAALAVLPAGPPTFVAVGVDVFADVANTSTSDGLAILGGSLSLDGNANLGGLSVWVDPNIPATAAVAGIRSGASFHELNPAVRVEVANVGNGGIDAGLFGYAATVVHKPGAFARRNMTGGTRAAK